MYDYPEEKELIEISKWEIIDFKDIHKLIDYIETLWWMPDWGFIRKRNYAGYFTLELHTGGWSGNESIISEMKRNSLFWSFCWRKSITGGHFWFKIRIK